MIKYLYFLTLISNLLIVKMRQMNSVRLIKKNQKYVLFPFEFICYNFIYSLFFIEYKRVEMKL